MGGRRAGGDKKWVVSGGWSWAGHGGWWVGGRWWVVSGGWLGWVG